MFKFLTSFGGRKTVVRCNTIFLIRGDEKSFRKIYFVRTACNKQRVDSIEGDVNYFATLLNVYVFLLFIVFTRKKITFKPIRVNEFWSFNVQIVF